MASSESLANSHCFPHMGDFMLESCVKHDHSVDVVIAFPCKVSVFLVYVMTELLCSCKRHACCLPCFLCPLEQNDEIT